MKAAHLRPVKEHVAEFVRQGYSPTEGTPRVGSESVENDNAAGARSSERNRVDVFCQLRDDHLDVQFLQHIALKRHDWTISKAQPSSYLMSQPLGHAITRMGVVGVVTETRNPLPAYGLIEKLAEFSSFKRDARSLCDSEPTIGV